MGKGVCSMFRTTAGGCVWFLCATCSTVVGDVTWNWPLMLGVFFFLCRWSRDLVVRSCSVSLTMNFRDRESSKLCSSHTSKLISFLHAIMMENYELFYMTVYSLYLPLNMGSLLRFTLGMTCLCLVFLFFL